MVYQTIFPINYNDYYYYWMTGIYLHIIAGLAWEIATSPIVMHGRSVAQPRVGTQNVE